MANEIFYGSIFIFEMNPLILTFEQITAIYIKFKRDYKIKISIS